MITGVIVYWQCGNLAANNQGHDMFNYIGPGEDDGDGEEE
jgi:hypothetical protein